MTKVNNKRKSLTALTKVGVLTTTLTLWKKPILNQVILPVHAQTSSTFMPSSSDLCEVDSSGNSVFLERQEVFTVNDYQFVKFNNARDGLYEIFSPGGAYIDLFQFRESMCGLPIDSIQIYSTSPSTIITIGEGPYGPIIDVRRGS